MADDWMAGYVTSRPEPLSRGKRLFLKMYARGALRLEDVFTDDTPDMAAWLEAQRAAQLAAQEASKAQRRRRNPKPPKASPTPEPGQDPVH